MTKGRVENHDWIKFAESIINIKLHIYGINLTLLMWSKKKITNLISINIAK